MQVEILLNFVTGYHDEGMYCDNIKMIGLYPLLWLLSQYFLCNVHSGMTLDSAQFRMLYLVRFIPSRISLAAAHCTSKVTPTSTATAADTCVAVWRYVHTPSLFLFDIVTSVPFSYYDFYVYQVFPPQGRAYWAHK